MLRKQMKSFFLSLAMFFSFSFAAHAGPIADLFHPKSGPVAGDPNGKITVVEFFDYQCSHCMKMAPIIQSIKTANPDVRFIFKDFPIFGSLSTYAAQAAIAADRQHKYYDFSHALLTSPLSLTKNNILDIAKSVGLHLDKLQKDIQSSSVKSQLQSNLTLARELNVNATPAFFIGKTNAKTSNDVNFVLGEMSQSELQDAINKARE